MPLHDWTQDNFSITPWGFDEITEMWDKETGGEIKFRTYNHGKSNSKRKAMARLVIIIKENAAWLDGSEKTGIDRLIDTFYTKLMMSLLYIKENGVDGTNDVLGEKYNARLTFWRFLQPDLKNLHYLSALYVGQDPMEALAEDKDRRMRKAKAFRMMDRNWKELKNWVGSLSSDPAHIEALIPLHAKAMAAIQDEAEWITGRTARPGQLDD